METAEFFLRQHAMVHAIEVGGILDWSFANNALRGLNDEEIRQSPGPGLNSIAWLVWHMARTEDATVNLLVAGRPQVLDDGHWVERLKLSRTDIGTGMDDSEVADFSARVDLPALMEYRNAVGRRTREIALSLRPDQLDEPVEATATGQLVPGGVLVEKAKALADFWSGMKKGDILALPGCGHNFLHLGEAITIRRYLRAQAAK